MQNLISNAFSLNMLANLTSTIHVTELDDERRDRILESWGNWTSVVGHEDTAAVFSDVLKRPVEFNRQTVNLTVGDMVMVGQYSGPRLPEGCKTLPEGASIKWVIVSVSMQEKS